MRLWLFLFLAAALTAGFLLAGAPAAVDWRAARVVALESDDWGLCGFVPCGLTIPPGERTALATGPVPAVYWESTLEDSSDVAAVARLLARHHGRDGVPAVLQANYILGSWSLAGPDHWVRRLLPALPPAYRRPGLWQAVAAAMAEGVWRPELHGLWHYDPRRRRVAVAGDSLAQRLSRRGALPFPDMQRAWELAPDRPDSTLIRELHLALDTFRRLFGEAPVSMIAPDYVWQRRQERWWRRAGLRVVQAKREQRRPEWGGGLVGRAAKWLERCWCRLTERRLCYLERNARLETAQNGNPAAVLSRCLSAVRAAWARGEPAVVECHRVNLVHCRPDVAAAGRAALSALLDSLVAVPPARRPLFVTDGELAALARDGCSVRLAGRMRIVRNGTHALRLALFRTEQGWRWVAVPAHTTFRSLPQEPH